MPEDSLQLFQFQGRSDAEHASFPIEAAVRDEDVAVRIEAEKISEGLHGDDSAGDGIILRNGLPKKYLKGFPGTSAQICQQLSIVEEVTAQDLRDAEDKMPVRNLFENIRAQLLPEFHHALLMAGGTEVTALAGKGQEIFMAAILAFDAGKTVVRVAAIQISVNNLLQIRPPEAILPGEMIVIDSDKGLEIVLNTSVIIG